MDTKDYTSDQPLNDITPHLINLLNAGWAERDIIKLIKIRGAYARSGQDYSKRVRHEIGSPDINHLNFIRWLYSKGHLQS